MSTETGQAQTHFTVVAGLWFAGVHGLATSPVLGRMVRGWGLRLLPLLLTAHGIRILVVSGGRGLLSGHITGS
jgi:hypothetical protein